MTLRKWINKPWVWALSFGVVDWLFIGYTLSRNWLYYHSHINDYNIFGSFDTALLGLWWYLHYPMIELLEPFMINLNDFSNPYGWDHYVYMLVLSIQSPAIGYVLGRIARLILTCLERRKQEGKAVWTWAGWRVTKGSLRLFLIFLFLIFASDEAFFNLRMTLPVYRQDGGERLYLDFMEIRNIADDCWKKQGLFIDQCPRVTQFIKERQYVSGHHNFEKFHIVTGNRELIGINYLSRVTVIFSPVIENGELVWKCRVSAPEAVPEIGRTPCVPIEASW